MNYFRCRIAGSKGASIASYPLAHYYEKKDYNTARQFTNFFEDIDTQNFFKEEKFDIAPSLCAISHAANVLDKVVIL